MLTVYKDNVNPKEQKSAVVYFLLDSSKSMEKSINRIKASLNNSIDSFTKLLVSGESLQPAPQPQPTPQPQPAPAPQPVAEMPTPQPTPQPQPAPPKFSKEYALEQWKKFITEQRDLNESAYKLDFFARSVPDWNAPNIDKVYYVQIGAYAQETNANVLLQALKKYSSNNVLIPPTDTDGLYKVRIGPLSSEDAEWLATEMRDLSTAARKQ
jgi:cell division septation protein DedD